MTAKRLTVQQRLEKVLQQHLLDDPEGGLVVDFILIAEVDQPDSTEGPDLRIITSESLTPWKMDGMLEHAHPDEEDEDED